jgi:hypothetical protein
MRVPKKNNGVPMIQCPKCNGAGEILLSNELMEVLAFVRKHPRCTTGDVRAAIDPKEQFHITAFNNRLDLLLKFDLVIRERTGGDCGYKYTSKS